MQKNALVACVLLNDIVFLAYTEIINKHYSLYYFVLISLYQSIWHSY